MAIGLSALVLQLKNAIGGPYLYYGQIAAGIQDENQTLLLESATNIAVAEFARIQTTGDGLNSGEFSYRRIVSPAACRW